MQVLSSLKTAKKRHRDCQIVQRKGKAYVSWRFFLFSDGLGRAGKCEAMVEGSFNVCEKTTELWKKLHSGACR